ncbi:hypothetical protein GUITHDRAFT_116986 [Guillardia theta CCMP2712]|uniref:Zn(2)-C6 fungal-type domain-containing protein n=1 Tax=Guillardia theta (strain CCMP2712) TaxID=905079 RepID=L1IM06_GUITC|nr:hypothetical protein GUITHDRAFT_116986 [Guillardia theta CCMP2712]EKX36820.1 hypothetical protein GUITHDRAFT_116986 [Guillardia theta CCMP2712]|eukprot:XP_005823800.1 hypothetical protein GUITHDRAFT_116986 [Guillardia theta CCMP2712]
MSSVLGPSLYSTPALPPAPATYSPLSVGAPSMADTASPVDPTQRSRAFAACLRCKLNKVKCDDSRPCTRCLRQGCGQACLAYSVQRPPQGLSMTGARSSASGLQETAGPAMKRRSCEGCRQKKVRCSMERPCSRCGGNLVQACRDCLASVAPTLGAWMQMCPEQLEVWRYSCRRLKHRRKHVVRACEACRRSKVGCDEGRPCLRCLRTRRGCRDSLGEEAGKVDGEQEDSDEGVEVGDGGALLGEDEGAGSWEGLELEEPLERSNDWLLLAEEEARKEAGRSFWEDGGIYFCCLEGNKAV